MGKDVYSVLEQNGFNRAVTPIVHYSALAGAARNAAVAGHEDEFSAFSKALSMQNIIDVAEEVMRENSISAKMCTETVTRLRKATLSQSRKKLAFIYSTVFMRLKLPRRRFQPATIDTITRLMSTETHTVARGGKSTKCDEQA